MVSTIVGRNASADVGAVAPMAVADPVAPKARTRGMRTGAALASLLTALRADLASGAYHPRERLIEADLVARYGTTRAAVRDALIQLTSEGTVERLPNRGARVRAMSLPEAIEIAEVRRLLECLCARRAAERAQPDEIEAFRELARNLHAAAVSGTVSEYLTLNARFHAAIHTMARHTTAQAILEQFQHRPIDRFFPQEFRTSPPAASVDEHQRIAHAIAARDPEAAEKAMYEHLANLVALLKRFEPHLGTTAGGGE
jgi:DNA-binding GntR family transcriptional regulator